MPSKHTAYLTYLRLLPLPLSQIQLVGLVYCMLISHLHKKQHMYVRLPLTGLSMQKPGQRRSQSRRQRTISPVRLSYDRTKIWLPPAVITAKPERKHELSISLRTTKIWRLMMKLELLNYIWDPWFLFMIMSFCSARLKINCKIHKHWMTGIKWIKEIKCHFQMASVRITEFRSDLHRSTFTYCAQERDL